MYHFSGVDLLIMFASMIFICAVISYVFSYKKSLSNKSLHGILQSAGELAKQKGFGDEKQNFKFIAPLKDGSAQRKI